MNFFLLLLINVIILGVFFYIFTRRFKRYIHSDKVLENIRQEIERLLIEVNQVSDQNITLLDDKIRAIRIVLEESRKTISLLKRERTKRIKSEELYADMRDTYAASIMQQAPRDATLPKPETQMPEKFTVAHTDQSTEALPVNPAPPIQTPELAGTQERKQQIVELYQSGFSVSSIANRLALPVGEVELIVSLHHYPPAS